MNALMGIDPKDIKEFLGKGWLTHDGMWFFNVYRTFGMDAANTLNRAAIKSMAPFEVSRCRKLLGMEKKRFKTGSEVKDFMDGALQSILPEFILSAFRVTVFSKDTIQWAWQDGRCFAYEGMKRLGLADQYVCGVIYRIECWLDCLRVPYKVNPRIDACIMAKTGRCSGQFVFRFEESG